MKQVTLKSILCRKSLRVIKREKPANHGLELFAEFIVVPNRLVEFNFCVA